MRHIKRNSRVWDKIYLIYPGLSFLVMMTHCVLWIAWEHVKGFEKMIGLHVMCLCHHINQTTNDYYFDYSKLIPGAGSLGQRQRACPRLHGAGVYIVCILWNRVFIFCPINWDSFLTLFLCASQGFLAFLSFQLVIK